MKQLPRNSSRVYRSRCSLKNHSTDCVTVGETLPSIITPGRSLRIQIEHQHTPETDPELCGLFGQTQCFPRLEIERGASGEISERYVVIDYCFKGAQTCLQ
jgi:hypothetical protein